MNRRGIKIAFICAYVCAGVIAAAYIAVLAYFLLNKTMPGDLAVDTWLEYWNAYSGDPVQHKRLLSSLFAALALVYGVPIALLLKFMNRPRSLHGDARWAAEDEIKDAGLL